MFLSRSCTSSRVFAFAFPFSWFKSLQGSALLMSKFSILNMPSWQSLHITGRVRTPLVSEHCTPSFQLVFEANTYKSEKNKIAGIFQTERQKRSFMVSHSLRPFCDALQCLDFCLFLFFYINFIIDFSFYRLEAFVLLNSTKFSILLQCIFE